MKKQLVLDQLARGLAMQGSTIDRTTKGFVVIHPLDPEDAAITAAMRAMASSTKGARRGIEARDSPTLSWRAYCHATT